MFEETMDDDFLKKKSMNPSWRDNTFSNKH